MRMKTETKATPRDEIICGEMKTTKYETLINGKTVPVYEPYIKSEKIKSRKYRDAIGKYKSLKNVSSLLDRGHKVIGFEDILAGQTDEEKLVSVSSELMILEGPDQDKVKGIISKQHSTFYKHLSRRNSDEHSKNVCQRFVSDESGVMELSFQYHQVGSEKLMVKFALVYIERSTLKVTKHENEFSLEIEEDQVMQCEIILCNAVLCVVWKTQNVCSRWNFNNQSGVSYLQFDLQEDLMDAYAISLDEEYLQIITRDEEFYDDVFDTMSASKRLSVYYSHATGERVDTKQAITEALEQDCMNYPTDIVFLNIPSHPTWMVFEWLLTDMTLVCVYFYKFQDGHLKKDGQFRFRDIFSEYKIYFGELNELQSKITVTRDPWKVFFWTSRNNALVVDPRSYEIIAILKMNMTNFKDFKSEFYNFEFDISKHKNNDVTVYVSKYHEMVHFSKFIIKPNNESKAIISTQEEDINTSPQKTISALKIDLLSNGVINTVA